MTARYAFVSRWAVTRSRESLWDTLETLLDTNDPMLWWPSVHVERYDGTTMNLRAKSKFGYSLGFELTNLQKHRPDRLTFTSSGELNGSGIVTFVDAGDHACHLHIDWKVSLEQLWLRRISWLLRPLFRAGHIHIMRQGEHHLNDWLNSS